jgi:hypothetical protein
MKIIKLASVIVFSALLLNTFSCTNPNGQPHEIIGSQSVCVNQSTIYRVSSDFNSLWEYKWSVFGGSITGFSPERDSIWVTWDSTHLYPGNCRIICRYGELYVNFGGDTAFLQRGTLRKDISMGSPSITLGCNDVCLDPDVAFCNYAATVPQCGGSYSWSVSPQGIGTIINHTTTTCRVKFLHTGTATISLVGTQGSSFYTTHVHTITSCPGNVPK